jgi:hypothetical protein
VAGLVGPRVRGPSPASAIVAIVFGCPSTMPDHSRGQQGDESAKLFAVASFGQSRPGAPLVRRVRFRSASWMRTPLGPSRTSKSLHRTVPTSDAPLSPPGTPESASFCRPMRCSRHAPRGWCAELDLSARGLRFTPPVRAEWARARERLSSYPEPSSRNPRPVPHEILVIGAVEPAHRFAFCPPVPRVRRCFGLLSG